MTFKKIAAIGTILANLAMPIYAKMYEKGMKTELENKHNIDLIGNFSEKETEKISNVMNQINEKADRKKAGSEHFTIENVNSNDIRLLDDDGDSYASAVVNNDKNILISTNAINGKPFDRNPLADYEGLLAHEIGHLIYPKYAEEVFDKFWDFNIKADRYKESEIPDGYVTAHPMERAFWVRDNEDFADTFSYWINDKKYADDNPIVQKKLNFVKQKAGK